MDAQRFDHFAKQLAGRLSRRHALRGAGAAASATMLAAVGMRSTTASARAQNGDGSPVFTMIRRYTLSVPATQVRAALESGYVADACKAPGFVAYFAVEGDNNELATIAVFSTQQDLDNFTNAEADWIAQNLADLLPSPDEAISGPSYIHAADTEAFPNTCDAPPPSVPTPTPASARRRQSHPPPHRPRRRAALALRPRPRPPRRRRPARVRAAHATVGCKGTAIKASSVARVASRSLAAPALASPRPNARPHPAPRRDAIAMVGCRAIATRGSSVARMGSPFRAARERANRRRSARPHHALAKAAPATAVSRGTAIRGWSAVRVASPFPAARGPARRRPIAPRPRARARGAPAMAACREPVTMVWSAARVAN